MGRTLYDLLEVSERASPEVIHAAYARLSEKLKSGISLGNNPPDIQTQLRGISDAYHTLSSAQSRQRYDASLAIKNVILEEEMPFFTRTKIAVLCLIAVFGLGVYFKHSRDVALEQAELTRVATEQAENERQAKLIQEKESRDRADTARRQAQLENDRRNRDYVSARTTPLYIQQSSDQQVDREQRYAQQRADADRQRREQEAIRRAEADKRRLQELEYQNRTNRPSIVIVPR